MKYSNLVVGGTSGLGFDLACEMAHQEEPVIVTGRDFTGISFLEFRKFELSGSDLPARIGQFVTGLPPIKSLVYAAGFYQEGHITDLSDDQVEDMIDVGGRGLIFFVKKLLEKQDRLDELITITSTSQWVPREHEPVYNFVKAGAAHYSHGQSLDPRIAKTLVIGPSGMSTAFWEDTEKDTSEMMSPTWVAEQIMDLRKTDKPYTFAKILGAQGELPDRVEVVDQQRPESTPFNVLIRQQRASLGLSVNEAAELVGVSRQFYCALERGRSYNKNKTDKKWQPRPKTLLKVAQALEMNKDQLLATIQYNN